MQDFNRPSFTPKGQEALPPEALGRQRRGKKNDIPLPPGIEMPSKNLVQGIDNTLPTQSDLMEAFEADNQQASSQQEQAAPAWDRPFSNENSVPSLPEEIPAPNFNQPPPPEFTQQPVQETVNPFDTSSLEIDLEQPLFPQPPTQTPNFETNDIPSQPPLNNDLPDPNSLGTIPDIPLPPSFVVPSQNEIEVSQNQQSENTFSPPNFEPENIPEPTHTHDNGSPSIPFEQVNIQPEPTDFSNQGIPTPPSFNSQAPFQTPDNNMEQQNEAPLNNFVPQAPNLDNSTPFEAPAPSLDTSSHFEAPIPPTFSNPNSNPFETIPEPVQNTVDDIAGEPEFLDGPSLPRPPENLFSPPPVEQAAAWSPPPLTEPTIPAPNIPGFANISPPEIVQDPSGIHKLPQPLAEEGFNNAPLISTDPGQMERIKQELRQREEAPVFKELPVELGKPEDDAPQREELVQPNPVPHVIAYKSHLDLPLVHSICSLTLRPDYDEINPALAVFTQLQEGEVGFIQLATRPAAPETLGTAQEMLTNMNLGEPLVKNKSFLNFFLVFLKYLIDIFFFSMSSSRGKVAPTPPWKPDPNRKPPSREVKSEEDKAAVKFAEEKVQSRKYFESCVYMGAIGSKEREQELEVFVQELQAEFNSSYSNGATGQGLVYSKTNPIDAVAGLLPQKRFDNCIFTPHELGEMFKIPDSQTGSHSVSIDRGMKSVPPRKPIIVHDPLNPPPGILAFGEMHVGTSNQAAIGLPIKGLNTHMYLCGTTGSGKSTMLEWFIYGLAKNGKCIFVVDPHGTLVDNSLKSILAYAPERADDVLILDFGDSDFPISFNPIAVSAQTEIEPAANSVKEMILKMLGLSADGAPRAVNYVEQSILAMAECNLRAFGDKKDLMLTMLQVPDFFTDKEFRQLVVQFCTNISIRQTFAPDGPFETLGERIQLDHVMPVLRTFSALATKESFANIFGQSESKIDFTKWVREKKLVMMKLPAIASDSQVATFIGAMVTPMIIASTAKWGHEKDLSAYLMIDEFQNYATESYEALLAQTRKYGLHGISANQVPQQLPAKVLQGIQSNTQTKISMRLDPAAVRAISDFIASGEAHPKAEDILALPNYWGWINHMMDDGTTSGPFVFKGLAPPYDEDACDPDHPAWLPCMSAERLAEGQANYNRLLPQVTEKSRLASAARRDLVWEKRQNHVKAARTVMEQKIRDQMQSGAFDGPSTGSISEEIQHDQAHWRK